MNLKALLPKAAPYIVVVVISVVLACIYCKPALSGKVLQSGDDINAVSNVQNGHYGEPSWWNCAVFGGMPNYQIGGGIYKSEQLLGPVRGFFLKGAYSSPIWILIFYFLAFFALLRVFGVNPWLSIAGAIAIALSSYFIVIIAAGHGGKTVAITYITLVAAGFYLIYRKKYALGAVFAALFTAIGFSIHPQMAYYLFMMMGLFFIAEIFIHAREKRWKDFFIATAIFVAAVGIGLGTGTSNIFANSEYAEQTMRGGHSDLVKEGEGAGAVQSKGLDIDYATQWSYGIDETMTFLIPGFKGGSSNHPLSRDSHTWKSITKLGMPASTARDFCSAVPLYWGEQPFTAGNVYMGAIVCFLFILGCLIVTGPYKWALLAATVLSTMLAWGYNCMWLTELFFKYFPLYNKFRAVSSILIVAEIAMPLLGFLALKALMEGSVAREKARKSLFIAGGVTGGLCLIFSLLGGSIFSFVGPGDAAIANQLPEAVYDAILADRADLLRGDAWRSLLFIAGAFLVVWLYSEKKLKAGWMIGILAVLILADMWPVDKRYFNDSYFKMPKSTAAAYEKQPWEELLLQESDPHFRIMNLTTNTFNESRSNYWLKSIGGYHAAKLRRYQDLIDQHLSKYHWPVIGMLNAKYLIVPGDDGQPTPQLNPYALGNAWYVGELKVVDGANAESDALNTIDLSNTAVLDRPFESYVDNLHPGVAPDASVELTYFRPSRVEYDTHSSAPGTVVFSEIYYPYGWKAFIDGEPADHFRVNYMLRALNVPAGDHHVSFVFDPDSVRKGDAIATVCIVLLYLLIFGAVVFGVTRLRRARLNA